MCAAAAAAACGLLLLVFSGCWEKFDFAKEVLPPVHFTLRLSLSAISSKERRSRKATWSPPRVSFLVEIRCCVTAFLCACSLVVCLLLRGRLPSGHTDLIFMIFLYCMIVCNSFNIPFVKIGVCVFLFCFLVRLKREINKALPLFGTQFL